MTNNQIASKIVSDFIAESEREQSLSIENIESFIIDALDKKDAETKIIDYDAHREVW